MTTEPSNEQIERTRDLSAGTVYRVVIPGVPAELRERLAREGRWQRGLTDWQVDFILAEIAASGHVIVASDRLERIERVAISGRAYCRGLGQYGDLVAAVNTLRPGDIDPVEPGAGR